MISIIIPVYNSKEYIEKAIESCLKQEYQNFEIIIIDDGSTDGLSEKILKKKSSRICYFYQENSGPGYARNLGLKYARGDFIFFLDADDELEKDALISLHVNIFKHDFIIGKSKRVFIDKYEKVYKEEIWKEKIYKKSLDKYDLVLDTTSTNKLYKLDFLLNNKLLFESGSHEDIIFVLKLFESSNNFKFLDKVIYSWNVRDKVDSRSSLLTVETLKERIDVVQRGIEYTNDERLKKVLIQNALEHDIQRYVNSVLKYNIDELEVLYNIYKSFVEKYQEYIEISLLEPTMSETIKNFLTVSKRHVAGKFYIKKIISHSIYVKLHKLNLFCQKIFG